MKKNLLGISLLTITGLYFLLSAVLILAAILLEIPVIYSLIISILVLIIQFFVSPFLTDLSMKLFYKVKFDVELPEYLKTYIQQVCNEQQMKYPRIGYIDDGAPNAFTYGHTKNDARIILTRGDFDLLSQEEIKAVVGHELGHAVHYDMLFMTVAQLVPLLLYAIYEICIDSDNSSNNDKEGNYKQIVGIIAYVLYIISNYIVLALSRTREYYADSFAIESTKNPNALASALVKIGYGLTTSGSKSRASKSNALGIFDSKASKALIVSSMDDGEISKENIKQAMKWEQWNYWAKWYEFNSTHPLISQRLLAISARSQEFNQEPYIVFDLQKTESYMDDFLIELVINFLPTIGLILGVIISILMYNNGDYINVPIGITLLIVTALSYIKFKRRYRGTNFKPTDVKTLLGEVKVSHITSIPCELEGNIIGRGNPGCIFNEDFVIKDDSGIIFLDYNQPVNIVNKIFALFKSKDYFDKKVKVRGWYRRSPVPYVELKELEMDGKVKNVVTYTWTKVFYILLIALSLFLMFYTF